MKFYTKKYFEDTKLGATEKLYLYINIAVYKYSKLYCTFIKLVDNLGYEIVGQVIEMMVERI